jgi:hypothetical protein
MPTYAKEYTAQDGEKITIYISQCRACGQKMNSLNENQAKNMLTVHKRKHTT